MKLTSVGVVMMAMVSSPHALWFASGHRIIARIAETRLTDHTRAAVHEILGGQSLADASVWADEIKTSRRNTSALHYVNIPLQAKSFDRVRDCANGRCIIDAIEAESQRLKSPRASPVERAEALKFLIHFVGDLHQPLHVSDNGDRGGNLTQVRFEGAGTNLHAIWDGQLYQSKWPDEAPYTDYLLTQLQHHDLDRFEQGNVESWAMEAHWVARSAYRFSGRQLDSAYVEEHIGEVDLQLIRAGVRLASVLNEALAGYQLSGQAVERSGGQEDGRNQTTYPDREAAAHVGETATVVGTVVSVTRVRSGNIYLNFGAAYPHQTFSGAILNPTDSALLNLNSLRGKRVGVRGTIKLYKGQPEILITSREQITVF